MIPQLSLDLVDVGHKARHLSQFPVDWRWRCPRFKTLVQTAQHPKSIGIHVIGLCEDTLVLSKLTGLVRQHNADVQTEFVQMGCQLLVIDTGGFHHIAQGIALQSLFTAPFDELVETCLVVVKHYRGGRASLIELIHTQAGRERTLCNVDSHALHKPLARFEIRFHTV